MDNRIDANILIIKKLSIPMHIVYIFFIDINTKYLPCQSSSRHKYPLRHLVLSGRRAR